MEFGRLRQDLQVKDPRLFCIKTSFDIYYVVKVDQTLLYAQPTGDREVAGSTRVGNII